ncbi:cytochrome P450 [Podospora didyma]|uniref:Cytochrome P450 n=1 Tax=Podospora didyma TaxID=330526 RepID=A0AAE0U1Y9_9PEZI|nr:cytochrome P450 [Podospora didyma]
MSLNLPTALASAFFLSLLWYIATSITTYHRLRHIPGPWLASFSYLWLILTTFRNHTRESFLSLVKYGALVRVGPNYLVTSDPEILRKIQSARSTYVRDPWYASVKLHPHQDSLFNILDNDAHDILKTKTMSGYSGRENGDPEVVVDSQIIRLLTLIRRKYLSTDDKLLSADFGALSRYFTLDVITRLAFGEPFGHLDDGTDVYGWIEHIDRILTVAGLAGDIPLIRNMVFSKWGTRLFGPKPTDKRGVGRVTGVVQATVRQRFEQGAKPQNDGLGGFMRNGLTPLECEAETMLQIGAGSDTSATAIRGMLMYLMTTPRAYIRLKSEIKHAVEQNQVSSPITFEQAQKLPYLQASPLPFYLIPSHLNHGHYKRAPPEGDTINGIFIPGGTAIGHNTLAITRNEAIFGQDVEVFRPERFLECSGEKRKEMERALDILWGGGRWTCAGRNVALMELNKVIFELMRVFDFQLVDIRKPWEEFILTITMHKNMWIRITEADKLD